MAEASTFTVIKNICNTTKTVQLRSYPRYMPKYVTSNMLICNIRNHFTYVESKQEWLKNSTLPYTTTYIKTIRVCFLPSNKHCLIFVSKRL